MTLTLQTIATGLNGRVVSGTVRCAGPGHSKLDDSLVVFLAPDDPDGFTVFSHANDDWRECKNYVRSALGLRESGLVQAGLGALVMDRRESAVRGPVDLAQRNAAKKLSLARGLWGRTEPLRGSLSERYLTERLAGLDLPQAIYDGEALRNLPANYLPRNFEEVGQGSAAAMVALMTDPITNDMTGIHLTFVTPDAKNLKIGSHSVRRMWGTQGIIRLWCDADVVGAVAIGEGIETCLAGHILRGGAPTWSAVDAGGIARFPLLQSVRHLTVYVDNDKGEAGEKAAIACRGAWEASGRYVVTEMPPDPGTDFNDFLIALAMEVRGQ